MEAVGWRVVGLIPGRGNCPEVNKRMAPSGTGSRKEEEDFGLKSLPMHRPAKALSRPTCTSSFTAAPKKAAQAPMAPSKPVTPRAGTADGLFLTWLGLT